MRRVGWSIVVVLLVVVVAAACSSDDADDDAGDAADSATTTEAPTTTTTAAAGPAAVIEVACAGAVGPGRGVRVGARQLVEASGLAASRSQPDVFWAHNDSGDVARSFAFGSDGTRLGTYELDGAEATDWEDMAIGPAPSGEQDVLYFGDIGDNNAVRDHITLYRVPEPEVPTGGPVNETVSEVETLDVTYPGGPRDAEALLIDPQTDTFVIIEKSLQGGPVGIYAGPLEWPESGAVTLERIGDYTVPDGPGDAVTAADLSADGATLAVRSYGNVRLWDRGDAASVADVLATEPCEGPLPTEVQGEAIALLPDGSAYATIPESVAGLPVRMTIWN